MRVRANGEPITADGILEDAIELGRVGERVGAVDPTDYFELAKDLAELISREQRMALYGVGTCCRCGVVHKSS